MAPGVCLVQDPPLGYCQSSIFVGSSFLIVRYACAAASVRLRVSSRLDFVCSASSIDPIPPVDDASSKLRVAFALRDGFSSVSSFAVAICVEDTSFRGLCRRLYLTAGVCTRARFSQKL